MQSSATLGVAFGADGSDVFSHLVSPVTEVRLLKRLGQRKILGRSGGPATARSCGLSFSFEILMFRLYGP